MANGSKAELLRQADRALADGRYEDVELLCLEMISAGDISVNSLSRLAVGMARQGKWTTAERHFLKVCLLHPEIADGYANLARARTHGDELSDPTNIWLYGHISEPRDPVIANDLADAASNSDRFDLAIRGLQVAAANGPVSPGRAYALFDCVRILRTGRQGSILLTNPFTIRIALVTAADEGYAFFLKGLVNSIRDRERPNRLSLCILDLGLEEATKTWLRQRSVRFVKPDWDLNFPDRDSAPETFKALTARPFLPRHFPDFDVYLWMDADTWIQDSRWLDDFILSALLGRLAIVPEVSPAYLRQYQTIKDKDSLVDEQTWRHRAYALCYDAMTADDLAGRPTLNSGVFALRADAPHWEAWQYSLERALSNTRFPLVEQTALNHAVYANRLITAPLPALANWQTHRRLPLIDPRTNQFCEPYLPHDPIGILHVTGPDKRRQHRLLRLDGRKIRRSLLYKQE